MADTPAPPTSVRLKPEVKDGLAEWADAQDRSLSWAINHACEEFLAKQRVLQSPFNPNWSMDRAPEMFVQDEGTTRILRDGGRVQTGPTSFLEMPNQSEAEKEHFRLLMSVGHGDPEINGPARDKLMGKLPTEKVFATELQVADLVWIEGRGDDLGVARRVDGIEQVPSDHAGVKDALRIRLVDRGVLGGQAFASDITLPGDTECERVITNENLDWATATDARRWTDKASFAGDDTVPPMDPSFLADDEALVTSLDSRRREMDPEKWTRHTPACSCDVCVNARRSIEDEAAYEDPVTPVIEQFGRITEP